jgi:hypothetical protein
MAALNSSSLLSEEWPIERAEMNDAQQSRSLAAYDLAKRFMRDYRVLPSIWLRAARA